jgi:hypothetical protein
VEAGVEVILERAEVPARVLPRAVGAVEEAAPAGVGDDLFRPATGVFDPEVEEEAGLARDPGAVAAA